MCGTVLPRGWFNSISQLLEEERPQGSQFPGYPDSLPPGYRLQTARKSHHSQYDKSSPELIREVVMTTTARALVVAFWIWSVVVAVAGVLGATVHCDSGACKLGSPSWLEPWTWREYDVTPEIVIPSLAAFMASTAAVLFVFRRVRHAAITAVVACLGLLAYPYFVGFPYHPDILDVLWIGGLFGVGAICLMPSGRATTSPQE